jgi:hypothetical protein
MKKIFLKTANIKVNRILSVIIITFVIFSSSAQVRSNLSVTPNASDENVFLDGSSNFDISANGSPNIGKGLGFPSTNLTEFQFIISESFSDYPTALDGMIVYNTATGSTKPTTPFGGVGQPLKADNGAITTVVPGFYYFYNPIRLDEFGDPLPADTVEFGKWIPVSNSGSGVSTTPVKNIVPITPIDTGIAIDGKTIWAVKGSFTIALLNATAVILALPKPDGLTGYTKMTTYKDGKTFRSDVSSLTIDPLPATNTITVVTGNGLFSEVYPAGDYTYTLEYFK